MKISVKASQGGGMFGGNPSSEVSIEGSDYEMGQATIATLMVLAANGIGEYPSEEDDETTLTGDQPEPEGDDVPAAGWADGGEKGDPGQRESNPGDAVRITWHGDDSSRLFIDSGTMWVSPAVAGLISEPMSVEYDTTDISVEVVASWEPHHGRAGGDQ